MEFSNLLKPEGVKVISSVSSKKRLLHDVADLAHGTCGVDAGLAVEALLEREALGPTGVGQGVALPHARLAALTEVTGMFVLLEKPIEFESVDRQPVDLIFGLLAPEDSGVEHLKALALVSRTLRDKAICQKLRANPDASKLYTILTENHTTQAA